ncbi:C6 transcription factor [Colletotrichum musicola]|uniref:C6 transcription factor n=1 Tax=Colletotrichum musicola TaxID=2175873 RepID=A0A8H6J4W9_9PEZI|nr:C6 transcription factor [Colletotrichum musicola]
MSVPYKREYVASQNKKTLSQRCTNFLGVQITGFPEIICIISGMDLHETPLAARNPSHITRRKGACVSCRERKKLSRECYYPEPAPRRRRHGHFRYMNGPPCFSYSAHHPFPPAPLYDIGLTSPVSVLPFHTENDGVFPLPSPSSIDTSQANLDSAIDQLLGLEPGSPASPGHVSFNGDVCTTPKRLSADAFEFDMDVFDVDMMKSAPPSSIGTVDSVSCQVSPRDNLAHSHKENAAKSEEPAKQSLSADFSAADLYGLPELVAQQANTHSKKKVTEIIAELSKIFSQPAGRTPLHGAEGDEFHWWLQEDDDTVCRCCTACCAESCWSDESLIGDNLASAIFTLRDLHLNGSSQNPKSMTAEERALSERSKMLDYEWMGSLADTKECEDDLLFTECSFAELLHSILREQYSPGARRRSTSSLPEAEQLRASRQRLNTWCSSLTPTLRSAIRHGPRETWATGSSESHSRVFRVFAQYHRAMFFIYGPWIAPLASAAIDPGSLAETTRDQCTQQCIESACAFIVAADGFVSRNGVLDSFC